MSSSKKLLQAASGFINQSGSETGNGLFNTFIITGDGNTTRNVNNGIDLTGGGMVWTKQFCAENFNSNYVIGDSELGLDKYLTPNSNAAATSSSIMYKTFNNNGFTTGHHSDINHNGSTNCFWTFKKHTKFFDIVTYSGTGSAQTISHDLGSVPGCIITKRTDSTSDWAVYHRRLNNGTNPEQYGLYLNSTQEKQDNADLWNDTAPTASVFSVKSSGSTNASGGTYVAYLFAHNDGDGIFGSGEDEDFIKCGSYQGNSSTVFTELGFEPQWLLIKNCDHSSGKWSIFDKMRGFHAQVGNTTADRAPTFEVTETGPEDTGSIINTYHSWSGAGNSTDGIDLAKLGFIVSGSADRRTNYASNDYVYIAMRDTPITGEPTSGSQVFNSISEYAGNNGTNVEKGASSGEIIDKAIFTGTNNISRLTTRATGYTYLERQDAAAFTQSNSNHIARFSAVNQDSINVNGGANTTGNTYYSQFWTKQPGAFDIQVYKADGNDYRKIPHRLGVTPEMICIKNMKASYDWIALHKDLSSNGVYGNFGSYLRFNTSASQSTNNWANINGFRDSGITSTYVETTDSNVFNGTSGDYYIMLLYATVAGVTKVGSYTGTGANINVDCGFSSGVRYLMIKNADQNPSHWLEWHMGMGLSASNEFAAGNDTAFHIDEAQFNTSYDFVDQHNSGFTVNEDSGPSDTALSRNGEKYIFLAVAK
jgi:hypothetical protein